MILKCLNTKSVIYKLLNVKTVRVSLEYWYRIQICSITGLARRTAFPPVLLLLLLLLLPLLLLLTTTATAATTTTTTTAAAAAAAAAATTALLLVDDRVRLGSYKVPLCFFTQPQITYLRSVWFCS